MTDIQISIPAPYALQEEIIRHPAKRKVVNAGRRAGKTTLAAMMAVERFLAGQRVLLSSTSQEQADVFWRYIKRWLSPLFDYVYKNEVRRVIALGDAEIRVKTGSQADALRGDNVNLLVLDECARLDPTAWQEVGAPMLADTNGDAVFISTPKRRNWFFELYTRGMDPEQEHWQSWHFTTLANPHLSTQALDMLTLDMTDEGYKQEILAHFLEGQGAVFRHVLERATVKHRKPYAGKFVFGVDFAQVEDFTVVTVMDVEARALVAYDRFNQMDWQLQIERIKTLYQAWKPHRIIAERNSAGAPMVEFMQRDGLPVEAFDTTPSSKPPLIESLVLAFDRDEISILDDTVITNELMAYERTVSATGRSKYNAPSGMHDDCVMSLALAWHGVQHASHSYFILD